MPARYVVFRGNDLLGDVDIWRPRRTRDGRVLTSLGYLLNVADFAEMEMQICDQLRSEPEREPPSGEQFGVRGEYSWRRLDHPT
jgi:hypothetical protein